jgi:CubicO group peptidase (beta-lactamase class C family)
VLKASFCFGQSDLRQNIAQVVDEYTANRFLNAVYMLCDDQGVIREGAKGDYEIGVRKLSKDQVMPIASATKTMTAASILKLQDKKLLDVQDLVIKHLPAGSGVWQDGKLPAWADKLKIHHLLTHTSGLPEYFMELKLDVTKPHQEINKDIINFAASRELAFEPGTEIRYNNTNFVLLGMIIEHVSGKPLGDFYRDELFQPLGMNSTRLGSLEESTGCQKEPESGPFPIRYFVVPTGASPQFNKAKADYIMIPFADGGVVSTAADLVKWHQALHTGKVLSEESYKLMTNRHYEVQDKLGVKNYSGYGLYIAELANGDVVYHHAGSALAIRSESGYIPARKLAYAVISNVMNYIPKEKQGTIDMSLPENQLDIHFFVEAILKAI